MADCCRLMAYPGSNGKKALSIIISFGKTIFGIRQNFIPLLKLISLFFFEISNHLLFDGFLKEKGFPVKGRGYATGLCFVNNKLYLDLILSDFSNRHLKIECDRNGNYIENGDIIFPPSADTSEKKEQFLLKRLPYKTKKGEGEC